MPQLNKPIEVRLLENAQKYFYSLNEKVQNKFLKAFDKTEEGFKGEWFKVLKQTDGLYEFRVRDQEKFYRMLAFWDKRGETHTLIIATHGFDKKTNKTPLKEIKKASQIKTDYFDSQ